MFDELLKPISDERPSGEYLKDNRALYRGYRNAFNVAQSSFRQLVETPDAAEDVETVNANNDNWIALATECSSCLQAHSKDVEILSWYTVSQVFTSEPLQNLTNALSLFEQIIHQYWDSLQPILPEKKRKGATDAEQAKEVVEHRVKPLLQLVGDTAESGLLYMPLQMLPLVGDIDYGRFYAAEKAGNLAELKQQAVSYFNAEQADIEVRILSLAKVLDAMVELEREIGEKCQAVGANGVSFRFVKESIERLISAMKFLVGEQFATWPLDTRVTEEQQTEPCSEQQDESVLMPSAQDGSTAQSSEHTGVINTKEETRTAIAMNQHHQVPQALACGVQSLASRDQALVELQKIADYFQQAEPHSPIYLLLKRAIRWGGMSLPELLQELVGDQESVNLRIQQLAGLESAEYQAPLTPANSSANSPVDPISTPVSTGDQASEAQASSAVSMPLDEPAQRSVTTNRGTDNGGLSQIEW